MRNSLSGKNNLVVHTGISIRLKACVSDKYEADGFESCARVALKETGSENAVASAHSGQVPVTAYIW